MERRKDFEDAYLGSYIVRLESMYIDRNTVVLHTVFVNVPGGSICVCGVV